MISIPDNISPVRVMLGKSPVIAEISMLITAVAPTDSTILITGETGTGKEMVAANIHALSSRSDREMVKMNCAALPVSLAESELFGHEKGAFTGALSTRIGKFEKAHKSTLLLDEIGDLSLSLQPKLLRAIQEKEIERVGGNRLIKTDVRIIAATHQDLFRNAQMGTFRKDLYFRLNVFPIHLPPLRERREDIELLATSFLAEYSAKAGRQKLSFSNKVIRRLMQHDWPGNIRELQHTIERTILLTRGAVIKEIVWTNISPATNIGRIKTARENERDHIIEVLSRCGGRIYGADGAAKLLDLPTSTLNSRIKKLGIRKINVFKKN